MVCGSRADGDFSDPAAAWAGGASRALADVQWTWFRQVHGSEVVVVERPGAQRGREADAAVTCCADAALAVLTSLGQRSAFVGAGFGVEILGLSLLTHAYKTTRREHR